MGRAKLKLNHNARNIQDDFEYERDKADERQERKRQFRIKDYLNDELLKRFKDKRAN